MAADMRCLFARAALAPLDLASDGAAPSDIQYMPPGRHQIRPLCAGKPVDLELEVTEETARVLQDSLEAAHKAGHRPWFDYNHEDGAASGHPKRFYWAGEDRAKGGVRVEVEWTPNARQAIAGREYRHLSPVFFARDGKVIGAPLNMGGLVNASAFTGREPLWNKASHEMIQEDTVINDSAIVAALTDVELAFVRWLMERFGLTREEAEFINNAEALPDDFELPAEPEKAGAGLPDGALQAYSPYQPRDERGRWVNAEFGTFRMSDTYRMITKKIKLAKNARTKADLLRAKKELRRQFNEWRREKLESTMSDTVPPALQRALEEAQQSLLEIKARLADAERSNQALLIERDTLKARLEKLEAEEKQRRASLAKAEVEAALRDGRIPQDEAIKARWTALIEADPENAALLRSLPAATAARGAAVPRESNQKTTGQRWVENLPARFRN